MPISTETWAIVAATGLGPVIAVGISLWREQVTCVYRRRLHVFRTLMSTRKLAISNDHVNAINLVEVEFYKCSGVESAWKDYRTHLNDSGRPEDDAWREKRDNLLARLLFEIGRVLKFDIPAIDIFQGGYAPIGWAHRDFRSTGALEYVYELSQGKNSIPMNVVGLPSDPEAAASQAEYLKLAAKNLREGTPWRIEIVKEAPGEVIRVPLDSKAK